MTEEIRTEISTDCSYYKDVMTEEIIIDGVDVAGCCQLVEEPFYPCGLGGECKGWENCYYKQLKRLEQENKKLKEEATSFMNGDYCANGCKKMNNAFRDAHTIFINQNNNYRSALEEIKRIARQRFVSGLNEEADCYNNDMEMIESKINEVLNENSSNRQQ